MICDELKEDGKKSSEVIIYDNLVSNAFKWTVLYEKAIIKVKQAIGRAIRGPQDSATIYLIDKRFTYKNVMEKMGLEVA
ncbi:helicase C-terminal domain-containing protein [Saccharolobus islandicus]|uniref:helicase C-terminal domain-containing protein n=1 Tax=Saccharolobus islandicus TaxID=43080 RepID=UPI0003714976|nr:helicase C-terminal domain-containing protein [Sulfolobus islandicus]